MNDDVFLSPQQISTQCICINTQRAARALARRYDAAFRPIGLTSGQFAILAALNLDAAVGIGTLADLLGLDRTTLTRNLAPLVASGLVRSDTGTKDKRVRVVALSRIGREKLGLAMPLWRAAQADSEAVLPPEEWMAARHALERLAER